MLFGVFFVCGLQLVARCVLRAVCYVVVCGRLTTSCCLLVKTRRCLSVVVSCVLFVVCCCSSLLHVGCVLFLLFGLL